MAMHVCLPSLKYCCCVKMEVVLASLLLATRVISPSLLMMRTSSELVETDFMPVAVVLIVVPMMESVNSLGVKEPVFDLVTIILPPLAGNKNTSLYSDHHPAFVGWKQTYIILYHSFIQHCDSTKWLCLQSMVMINDNKNLRSQDRDY